MSYLTVLLIAGLLGVALANTHRTCYSCEGINCMRTSLKETQQCLNALDYCMTIFEDFEVVKKGCVSQVPIELRKKCEGNKAECHKCNSDRCNDLGQENFKCVQCDSSKDSDCAKNAQNLAATRCAAPTAPNSYCYVKYENSMTKRGCLTTVAEQKTCYDDGNCMLCLPGDIRGCNVVNFEPGTRAKRF